MQALTTPEQIKMAQLLALRGALKLEMKGMTRRGRLASVILRGMGFSGRTKQQVLDSLEDYLNSMRG